VLLALDAEDDPTTEEHPAFNGELLGLGRDQTGVREMMLSNRADFAGAVWETYSPEVWWTLEPRADGLATVFVRFRDGAGNVSEVATATFKVDATLKAELPLYLPSLDK
jgi:hypothetical protein